MGKVRPGEMLMVVPLWLVRRHVPDLHDVRVSVAPPGVLPCVRLHDPLLYVDLNSVRKLTTEQSEACVAVWIIVAAFIYSL
jgi:hypothetical protein